jgi:hypothetical protein
MTDSSPYTEVKKLSLEEILRLAVEGLEARERAQTNEAEYHAGRKKLITIMEEHGILVDTLAKKCRMDPDDLSQLLKGHNHPTLGQKNHSLRGATTFVQRAVAKPESLTIYPNPANTPVSAGFFFCKISSL